MIVILSPTEPPAVRDADDFKSLSVETAGPVEEANHGDLVVLDTSTESDDNEHVWLNIVALQKLAITDGDDELLAKFDGMIGYAAQNDWLSPDGASVRAHID